jgi:hypothetical protein
MGPTLRQGGDVGPPAVAFAAEASDMTSLMIATILGSGGLICAWMAAHYGEIAERMHTESVTLNRRVTRWAGAALILGFAGAIIGVWPGSN